jgi:hypothetical protein
MTSSETTVQVGDLRVRYNAELYIVMSVNEFKNEMSYVYIDDLSFSYSRKFDSNDMNRSDRPDDVLISRGVQSC